MPSSSNSKPPISTTKNRTAALRWWAGKIGKPALIANSNDHYGIGRRQFVTNESKALTLEKEALERIGDPHVRLSLELQREFGWRREEAIKFIPRYAERGDTLVLQPSWTKGSQERVIPMRPDAQRDVLTTPARRAGLLGPQPSMVRSTKARVRKANRACGSFAPAWTSSPIRAESLPRAHRLESPGRREAEISRADCGSEAAPLGRPTHYQPGARA